jgi:hypothetical protein
MLSEEIRNRLPRFLVGTGIGISGLIRFAGL